MIEVLLIEDNPAIVEPLVRTLGREGCKVNAQITGGVALQRVGGCDIVTLDLELSDMDGPDVARTICAQGITIPILILTAHIGGVSTVVRLDSGADDYVTRPFRLGGLLARVRALLRRAGGEVIEDEIVEYQDVRVEIATHCALQDERELQLIAKKFDLLRALIRDAGSVVSRERVMREAWSSDPSGSTKILDMHALWLRREPDDDVNSSRYITTVRGMGSRFENV